jgi:hypothetical protein
MGFPLPGKNFISVSAVAKVCSVPGGLDVVQNAKTHNLGDYSAAAISVRHASTSRNADIT